MALSQRYGYRLQNSRFASAPGPNQTLASLIHLDCEPCFIRLLYVNDQAEPWTVDGAAVAASAARGDGVTPVGPDGRPDPGLFRRVSFAGRGADTPLALDPPAPVASLTVPGNPHDVGRPVQAWSDWLPVAALGRRDGGAGFLILVRTFARGLSRFAASTGGPDKALGRLHAGFAADGDASDGAPAAFTRNDRLFACHGVQIVSPQPGATVLGIGDSIMGSSCTTGEMSGFGVRACAMVSTPAQPVSYVNEGFPGRNSLGFCTTGLWAVAAFRPQVALIQPWTRNEPWTRAMADLAFARAMAVADAVRQQGGVPVLTTAAPSPSEDRDAEAARQTTNARVRGLAPQGWPILDTDQLWSQGGTPGRFRPGYDAGDGLHPNDRACADAAALLAPLLSRLIGAA